jgi:hypothetical protein
MLEILQYIFSSGWIFLGTCILLYIICDCIIINIINGIFVNIFRLIQMKIQQDKNNKEDK